MKTVKADVEVKPEASRMEWLIRWFYMIPLVIVLMILAVIAEICWVLQSICVLVLGKRIEFLANFIKAAWKYMVKMYAYFFYLTDERPEIMPEF